MTIGVGGSDANTELSKLANMASEAKAISLSEFEQRIQNACQAMQDAGLGAVYLNAGTNLYYFTGTRWGASERMVGALLTAAGEVHYIAPHFEISTLRGYLQIDGKVHGWHEHESPYALFAQLLDELNLGGNTLIGLDESCPFFISNGLANACPQIQFVDAKAVTAGCRMRKSPAELALMQCAKNMTLEVHKAAARILRPGISTQEVTEFIDAALRKVGAP